VEGVEVQQEQGPVTFAPSTAAEVELTLAMSSQRLRLRWKSGGVGGPWSDWVSAALAPLDPSHTRCIRRPSWMTIDIQEGSV
jgi:hypothetical protein